MKALCVIPARYASTRFPGKPLAEIQGMSMIERVYKQVEKSKKTSEIIVATDDQRILDHVLDFGGKAAMTGDHKSGTDRCFEVWNKQKGAFDILINVQGDEPKIAPEAIDQVIGLIAEQNFEIATLANKSLDKEEYLNPNSVKVVLNKHAKALYFSRAPIPFYRDIPFDGFLKHIGIYAFSSGSIPKIAQLKQSDLELYESLEQLRWLSSGFSIGVGITSYVSQGIDSPEDINKF
ncbi:MAG: 3-deoxy-manno-octulosonate cytidylyltransferase [Luteibaculum sp.]